VRTELGRSQVEVQRCALSWEGPRLRSSSAHWAPKLAKSLAKSWQGNSGRGSGGRGGRRGGGRGGGEGGGRRRRTTLIKSNNPHLAGGEKHSHFSTQTTGTWETIDHRLGMRNLLVLSREWGNGPIIAPCSTFSTSVCIIDWTIIRVHVWLILRYCLNGEYDYINEIEVIDGDRVLGMNQFHVYAYLQLDTIRQWIPIPYKGIIHVGICSIIVYSIMVLLKPFEDTRLQMGNIFPTFDGQEWFLVHQSSVRREIVQVQNPGGFDSWKSSAKTAKRTTNPPKRLANTQKVNDWRLPNKNTKH
jgi:hypothetical protein